MLNPCLNKHTEILGNTWKITGSMNLGKSIQSFANHKAKEANTSVSTHNKQHRFYRLCSEKLLNKQGTVLTADSSNNRPGIDEGVGGHLIPTQMVIASSFAIDKNCIPSICPSS